MMVEKKVFTFFLCHYDPSWNTLRTATKKIELRGQYCVLSHAYLLSFWDVFHYNTHSPCTLYTFIRLFPFHPVKMSNKTFIPVDNVQLENYPTVTATATTTTTLQVCISNRNGHYFMGVVLMLYNVSCFMTRVDWINVRGYAYVLNPPSKHVCQSNRKYIIEI